MRTRSNNAHVTFQHIEELRELIKVRLSHKLTERELPRIMLCCLHLVGIGIHMHRAELIAHKRFTIKSCSQLLEEHRSLTLQLDNQRNNRE